MSKPTPPGRWFHGVRAPGGRVLHGDDCENLTVTTTHKQRTDLKVGSTDPIGDTLHASSNGSSIKENLNGTAIIHYEGQKNGYVAAKTVSKPITFANSSGPP